MMIRTLLLLFLLLSSLYSQEKVILQLKWLHQFQFAGYYAAKEKGFYKELGLDVEIRERNVKYNNIEQVINGEAQYGVADSILLLYKSRNEPVVIVSPIFQHSASVLVSLKNSGINSPYNLDGKNILFYPNDTDGFSILAMLKMLNIKPNLIRVRERNDYVKLLNKEVDLTAGYLSNEPFYLKERKHEVNIINPANYGFDLYGDMLFTNEDEINNHPDRVKKFKEATLKGWEYALNNKEEIINLIHKKYNNQKSIEHLRYEADAIAQLVSKNTIPLGTIDEGRIKYISELYQKYGLTSQTIDIKSFLFQEYRDIKTTVILSKEEKQFLENNKVLKVSNELDWAPFDFAVNKKPQGYSIDILNLLAKKLGLNIEYINGYTWNELVELFKKGELDLLHSLAITQERKKFGIFSKPYYRYQTHFVTRDTNKEINSIEEIKDKTIVVGKDWAIDNFLTTNFPNLKLKRVSTLDEILNEVSSGKADVAILNKSVAEYFIKKKNLINVKVSGWCKEFDTKTKMLHFMAHKNSPELISMLNKALDSLSLTEVSELNKKWFGEKSSIDPNELNLREEIFLKKHPTVRFKVQSNRPPFEFLQNDEPVGIAIDYVKKSAKNIGLNVEFVINDESIPDTYKRIKTKRDLYDTQLFSVRNEKREKEFSFGTTYLSYPMMIITNKNELYLSSLKDLENKTIVLEKGYLTNKWIQRDYPNIKIVTVKGTVEALKMVNEGKVDAYVGNTAVANYMSVFGGLENIKVAAPSGYGSVKFSFIAPKEWPELTSILTKGYNKITPEEHISIQQKWFSIQTVEKIDYDLIQKIVIGVIILIIWFLWWNRRLVIEKNKTKKALKELELSQEEQLKQQQIILNQSKVASMGEMIGNIAHQWRQPLSAISASASGMKIQKDLGVLNDETMNNSIDAIMKNTQYLSETIDTFRFYLKEEKEYEEVVIQEIIEKAVDLISPTLNENKIELQNLTLKKDSVNCVINSGELIQVFINILNNAKDVLVERKIKEPLITINIENNKNFLEINIEDNAGGIKEDILSKVFDPYFTTKHQAQGTGLGLHMSHQIIVESLKGNLSVINTTKGAMFKIELPLN